MTFRISVNSELEILNRKAQRPAIRADRRTK